MVVYVFKIHSVMRNAQCVLMEVGVRQAMCAWPEATNLVSSTPLSASQPSTPSAPLEVNLVSAGLDESFLGSLPLFVSTLSVCEDIFSSAHGKGPPITHESCDKESRNPESTQKKSSAL